MINFVKYRKWFYALAIVLSIGAVIALVVPPRLPFGLEYTGGSAIDVTFTKPVGQEAIKTQLASIGVQGAVVQKTGETTYFIRSNFVEEDLAKRLQTQFGTVRTTELEANTDLAATYTFTQPVTAAQLQAAFGGTPPNGLIVTPNGERIYHLYTPTLTRAQLDAAAASLKPKFGEVQVQPFNGPTDLALSGQFTKDVQASDFAPQTADLGMPTLLAINLAPDTLLITARDVTDASKEALFKRLDERYGTSTRTDAVAVNVVTLLFVDPISSAQMLQQLAQIRAWEIVGSKATVAPQLDGTMLIKGQISQDDLNGIKAQLESELGPTDIYVYDPTKDLAAVLDFGAEADLPSIESRLPALATEPVRTEDLTKHVFALVSEAITTEHKQALLDGLQTTFGPATQAAYDQPSDLAIIVQFSGPHSLLEIKTAVTAQGIKDAVVSNINASTNRYFIGAKGIATGAKQKVANAFKVQFADVSETKDFDFSTGFATTLDFGPTVMQDDLQQAIAGAGVQNASVIRQEGEADFLVVAKGVSADAQDKLAMALQAKFGQFKRTPLESSQGLAARATFTDSAKVSEGIAKSIVVQKQAPGKFFIAQPGVTTDQQPFITKTLKAAFGTPTVSNLDTSTKLALILNFDHPPTPEALQVYLAPFGYSDLTVLSRPDGALFVTGSRALNDQRTAIVGALEQLAPLDRGALQFSSVDAQIAQRSVLNTFYAVLASLAGIAAYLWWAFRRIPKSLRFGFGAIFGLAHDVLIILGVFGLLAKFIDVEFNSLIVVGVLAIIGHSVNNTVIVFDRVRENFARNPSRDYESVVNLSLNETLTRNVNVAITVVLTILAVLLFGGSSVRDFMLVLLVGVLAGLYSSLFLSANLLVSWEKGELSWLRLPLPRRKKAVATQKA